TTLINDQYCTSCHSLINGDFIELSISDSGSGIPEPMLENLFEPFFTTKEVGKGTGMGLSIVHGIMHQHNGHILVESTADKGSTFRLLFPLEPLAD
ncbi:MAG: PAS domain-containing sensor histidine kinase, partial [Gammaproteobacteria bacterium]|nr:PAS domain-containing sensor histidine kinase [Gammaproteobacteria bacterium]